MNDFSSLSIRRPVLTIMLNAVIVLFGAVSLGLLGVRDFPAVDPPVVSVRTLYTGANADVIESQITEPLEEAINAVPGVRTLTSTSRDGRSYIDAEFYLGVPLETAVNDVRDKVSQALRDLPPDADPPSVAKADAEASPILFVTLKSDKRSHLELTDIADRLLKERLQTIPEVAEARIWGEKHYAMRLWLDPQRMAARSITAQDIKSALDRENVELPSGSVEGDRVELTLRTVSRLPDAEAFNNLILREEGGQAVRLRDVGRAEIGAENDRSMMKSNGLPTVGVALFPQPGSNHIAITDEFYKRLESVQKDLPPDLSTAIGFDTTRFVKQSLFEVTETIFLALGLVTLVIFLFLRNARTTLIPVLAIPISLVGSFFVMRLCGFSVNILTLLAIVLATGLVVDDAIVVLENIFTRIEKGQPPLQAAREGTKEIFFAVVSTTVTLASVFLPILFLEGNSGRLFREFAVVLAGSVIISSFVSLTLTPMLCSRLLRPGAGEGRFARATEPYFRRAVEGYRNSLTSFLERRWLAFPLLGACVAVIVLLASTLPSELAPLEDRSRVNVSVTAQEGSSFEFMDAFMNRLIDFTMREVPEIDAVVSRTSPGGSGQINTGRLYINLVDKDQRERSQTEIAGALRAGYREFKDARVSASEQQTIGDRRARDPVQFVLQAREFKDLQEKLPLFLEKASQQPELIGVDTDLKFTKPELRLTIDREKARALGISAADIARTLQFNLSETRYGYFIRDGKQYPVIGQLERADRDAPMNLEALSVRTPQGALVQLGNLVSFEESSTPPQLFRYNRFASATVNAGLAPGYTLSDGIAAMERVAAEILDESFTTALSGPARDFAESSSTLAYAFLFALVLVYMVLAAQFESFRDPIIVMVTVPLAFTGALISLWYFRQTLNIFSQIGILMLIGLVTKNGILIVEFANQRKAAGLAFDKALLDGAASRFRPIVMTTLTTVLGTLPIALALGAGAESRVSMGIAVIGGLLFSLLLTLYIIPAMYSYLSKRTPPLTDSEIDQGAKASAGTVAV